MPNDPEYSDLLMQLAADPADAALAERLHARYLALVRGGATPTGLPYPDPTDPVAEGADAIRALAEAIDPHIAEVDWTDIPLSSGYTVPPQYRIVGQSVEIRSASGGIQGSFPVGNTTVTDQVPVAIRPKSRNARGSAYLAGWPGVVTVGVDGTILITQQSGAARTYASFTCFYLLG